MSHSANVLSASINGICWLICCNGGYWMVHLDAMSFRLVSSTTSYYLINLNHYCYYLLPLLPSTSNLLSGCLGLQHHHTAVPPRHRGGDAAVGHAGTLHGADGEGVVDGPTQLRAVLGGSPRGGGGWMVMVDGWWLGGCSGWLMNMVWMIGRWVMRNDWNDGLVIVGIMGQEHWSA